MDKKRMRDILLAAGLLLFAGILYLLLRPGGEGAWAVVTADGQEMARYPLSEDRQVTIGEADYNILEIKDGAAAVIEANCGDHTCVRTGAVSREGEAIVCLPHRLIVRIEGGEGPLFDASVG
ncbi:MAG: NusG domain II-containing protein [Oscillospiraceae bacterium]|nr:NusG domain II-containing protein [Oscillospiraceae bacterium]